MGMDQQSSFAWFCSKFGEIAYKMHLDRLGTELNSYEPDRYDSKIFTETWRRKHKYRLMPKTIQYRNLIKNKRVGPCFRSVNLRPPGYIYPRVRNAGRTGNNISGVWRPFPCAWISAGWQSFKMHQPVGDVGTSFYKRSYKTEPSDR